MTTSKSKPYAILGTALVLASLGIFITVKAPAEMPISMPDGSIVTLERVANSRAAPREIGGSLFGKFQQMTARWFSRPAFVRWPQADSLVLWFSRRDKQTGAYLNFDWQAKAVAVDEHGCEFEMSDYQLHGSSWTVSGNAMPPGAPSSKYILASGLLTNFPRRQKAFKLRFKSDQGKVVSEFRVPNPVYRFYPTWKPEPFPTTKRAGAMAATLIGLTHHRLDPAFQVSENGQPTGDWENTRVTVFDATGNPAGGGERLCTNETAVKLQAEFFRRDHARFASNEIWTIPNVPIPPPGKVHVMNLSNTLQGVSLKLWTIGGPCSVTYSNGVPGQVQPTSANRGAGSYSMSPSKPGFGRSRVNVISLNMGSPNLVLSVTGLKEGLRFSVQPISDRDREALYSGLNESVEGQRLYVLDVPRDAKTVDLKFIVQERRVVEFLVPPLTQPFFLKGHLF
jgi:hypothetical protein